uniref:Thimet oligopeptidase isoform X1 n=2 Tax=Petromyzon marinus TaxID=7757 RepID=A0AAJ7T492_PETMA|nr:thimet oligopeptidase isoform X1 [Petromyzon marinus]
MSLRAGLLPLRLLHPRSVSLRLLLFHPRSVSSVRSVSLRLLLHPRSVSSVRSVSSAPPSPLAPSTHSRCGVVSLGRAMGPSHVKDAGGVPEILLRWNVAADEVDALTEEVIAAAKAVHDAVAAVPLADVTVASVLKPLADSANAYAVGRNQLDFLQHVSPSRAVREASTRADKRLSLFDVEAAMREDVHRRLAALQERLVARLAAGDADDADGDDGVGVVTPEGRRLLDRLVKTGLRNGLHLPADKQAEIKVIKEKISSLCIDFHTNLTEDNSFLEFTAEELKGMPGDFVSSLEKAEGNDRLKVTLKYPHYFPLMKKCSVEETRARMERAFTSRCIEANTRILEELLRLRWRKAQLLAFASHADFAVELNMAKTAAAVNRFLDELAERLAPLGVAERAEMLALKREETGGGADVALHAWDLRYYATRVEEERFTLDHDALRQYFPLQVVTQGLLGIYERLLGVRYELREEGGGAAGAWHEEVRLYRVTDAASQRLLGHFYLDLHPRDGKYGHAACFGLQPGCLLPSGERQPAVAAMVANFSRPSSADVPALLTHSEVETFFHEFGHVMHSVCAQADYAAFSGTHVERDFVEAPSQMLENWAWEAAPLALVSGHVRDGAPVPPQLAGLLAASRLANVGVFTLRQVVLSKLDQVIHSGESADTAREYSRLCSDIMGIPATPGTNMCASFGHLAGGYDAQYYGYLWSQVFSDDMFHSRFREQGIMDPAVGNDYRRFILTPGGSLDADVMLKNFLGRDPNNLAFLRSKGLAAAAVAAAAAATAGDAGKTTAAGVAGKPTA